MSDERGERYFRIGLCCGNLSADGRKRCGTKLAYVHVAGTAVVEAACHKCGAQNEFEWSAQGVRLVRVVPGPAKV